MKSTKEFIRSVVYAAESPENNMDKRITIYKNLQKKNIYSYPTRPRLHLHGYVVPSKTFKLLIQKNVGGN